MKLEDKIIFVSGADRGLGRAIVKALLKIQVKKVYASASKIKDLPKLGDARVVPIQLELSHLMQIKKAIEVAKDVNVLINNPVISTFSLGDMGEDEMVIRDMKMNYFGTLVCAFVPIIEKNGSGAIVNVGSGVELASNSKLGGYSPSEAALFSASQVMRKEFKSKNISIHTIFPRPFDKDKDKTSLQSIAKNIIKGIDAGVEDVFPDPTAVEVGELWFKNPEDLERMLAAM